MASETIVAMFNTPSEAQAVANELEVSGISPTAIELHTQDKSLDTHSATVTDPADGKPRQGFWSWILGEEGGYQDEHTLYENTIAKGGAVLSVIVSDAQSDTAYGIIEKHHPTDIEYPTEQVAAAPIATGMAETTTGGIAAAMPATAPTTSPTGKEGEVIALAEEELQVGKRQVQSGTARIRRFVVEKPVEEQIRLRTETARIERRPVTSGAAVGADAFSEKVIEVKETAEEAVVGKTARVVEEVVIGKDVTERVETVRDTVRREDLEVIQPGQTATPAVSPKV